MKRLNSGKIIFKDDLDLETYVGFRNSIDNLLEFSDKYPDLWEIFLVEHKRDIDIIRHKLEIGRKL
jgi:hypothetical protein